MHSIHPNDVKNGVDVACRRVINSLTDTPRRRTPCRPACVYICTEYGIYSRVENIIVEMYLC